MEWLSPWESVSNSDELRAELARECGLLHPLRGTAVTAIARRIDRDDVLFRLDDGSFRVALVHLTYRKEVGPNWPHTVFFANVEASSAAVMSVDHAAQGP
jgi:hypothetical protein